jgi:hypothetical protein
MVPQICYTLTMQKIATRVFIFASTVFGVLGILMVMTSAFDEGSNTSGLNKILQKLFMVSIFVILTSFALSVASKYLNNK